MPPPVIPIDPTHPDSAAIRQGAEFLRAGKLVAFPTETVYGLGANALDPAAVRRVFAAKGRPSSNPLIVHVADATQLGTVTGGLSPAAARLTEVFWPGPLTVVVPKTGVVPPEVTGGGPTVAVRHPDHPVAVGLIKAAGVPVAAPSANRSGQLSPTTAAHVAAGLGDAVDLILDAGPCRRGLESTVVDVTGPVVRLLRPGLVTVAQLEAVVGRVEVVTGEPAAGQALPSPGLLAKHYAPRTALEVAETSDEAAFLTNLYQTAGLRVATLPLGDDPTAAAARLYADLHALDAGDFDRIIVPLPPDEDEWRAVRDRLQRAAAES
jgi:L-threonylcarbamoyladenylate synthase